MIMFRIIKLMSNIWNGTENGIPCQYNKESPNIRKNRDRYKRRIEEILEGRRGQAPQFRYTSLQRLEALKVHDVPGVEAFVLLKIGLPTAALSAEHDLNLDNGAVNACNLQRAVGQARG